MIAKADSALSPLSRVLELRNLAETLAHESPAEALTMYRHALETLRAHDLDPRLAPALHNGLAYAAICAADLGLAATELDAASRDALRLRIPLMRAYAVYNRSILFELRDEVDHAVRAIEDARALSESAKLRDLIVWCWIRESWLALKRKDRAAADRASASARRLSGEAHADALATLDAVFTLVDGDHLNAAKLFGELARRYLARSDAVTAVTLLLWRSVAYRNANAPKGAKAAASEAALRVRSPSMGFHAQRTPRMAKRRARTAGFQPARCRWACRRTESDGSSWQSVTRGERSPACIEPAESRRSGGRRSRAAGDPQTKTAANPEVRGRFGSKRRASYAVVAVSAGGGDFGSGAFVSKSGNSKKAERFLPRGVATNSVALLRSKLLPDWLARESSAARRRMLS